MLINNKDKTRNIFLSKIKKKIITICQINNTEKILKKQDIKYEPLKKIKKKT